MQFCRLPEYHALHIQFHHNNLTLRDVEWWVKLMCPDLSLGL